MLAYVQLVEGPLMAAAGGANGIVGRLIAQKVSQSWPQPMIVENPAGGGGVIGSKIVARAPGNLPSAAPNIRAGKLRALGVTSATRNAAFPDVLERPWPAWAQESIRVDHHRSQEARMHTTTSLTTPFWASAFTAPMPTAVFSSKANESCATPLFS